MKLVVTVEFDGRDPIAEMIKLFGESMMRDGAPKVTLAAKPTEAKPADPKRGRGRPPLAKPAETQPVGVVTPVAIEAKMTRAEGLLPGADPGVVSVVEKLPDRATPVAIEPQPAQKVHKLEDVQKALEELFNAKGAGVAIGTLGHFQVVRARDLKPEQYPDFLVRVEATMKAPA